MVEALSLQIEACPIVRFGNVHLLSGCTGQTSRQIANGQSRRNFAGNVVEAVPTADHRLWVEEQTTFVSRVQPSAHEMHIVDCSPEPGRIKPM